LEAGRPACCLKSWFPIGGNFYKNLLRHKPLVREAENNQFDTSAISEQTPLAIKASFSGNPFIIGVAGYS